MTLPSKLIHQWRTALSMTQDEFATFVGLGTTRGQVSVSEWESDRAEPNLSQQFMLLRACARQAECTNADKWLKKLVATVT